MSEYQYYEFAAIDQPLTKQQQAELRRCSTRAEITASRFVNEYQWGDLKGDPLDWMVRYFDAHVYYANWGTSRLLLRLPTGVLDKEMLDACQQPSVCGADSGFVPAFEMTPADQYDILEWCFNDDSGEYHDYWFDEEQSGWLARLQPLRDELLRGDARPLYLGWLARVCAGELGDADPEPPLPAGLASLTPAQEALVSFLALDPDWLSAAAQASPEREPSDPKAMETWLMAQSETEFRAALRLLLEGRAQEAERGVRQAYHVWLAECQAPAGAASAPRTVGQIRSVMEAAREKRLERERRLAEAKAARAQAERAAWFAELVENPELQVQKIEAALERGSGAGYDQALTLTLELAEAMRSVGRKPDFDRMLANLLAVHGKRKAWVARLKKAGFSVPG